MNDEKKKEFKVNDFLTLKLEGNRTRIYIKGKRIIQCRRLFLQIPPQTSHLYEEIESIDEVVEKNRFVEGTRFQNRPITPEQEFWGHCSNIQAWAEHDYDTRLLHSNLSFPLLKELSDAGNPKAKAIFGEEIAIRLESGYPSVVSYLLEEGYLRYLDKDRLKTLLENYADVDDQFLEDINDAEKYHLKKLLEDYADVDDQLLEDIQDAKKYRIKKYTRLAKTKKTILIVGSKPKILDLIAKFLKLGEYDTINCNNTKEALRVMEERYNDIGLILLDPMMSGLNTEKFLQSVKSDERYKHILVTFWPKKFTSFHI